MEASMNTKNNKRSRDTLQRIQQVFIQKLKEKNISKITVQEICLQAGINRTTFYTHYQDVYDLMEQLESEMSELMLQHFTDEKTGKIKTINDDLFKELFQFILFHRDYYEACFRGSAGSFSVSLPILERKWDPEDPVYQTAGMRRQKDIEYRRRFFKAGLNAMIRYWLGTDCRETPEELSELIYRQYHPEKALIEVLSLSQYPLHHR